MGFKLYLAGALMSGAITLPSLVWAESTPEDVLRESTQTLQELKNNKVISSTTLAKAKCVAIFPNVTEAAVVVGGAHGHGVITCKNSEGKFSRMGFVDMSLASVGAQIGAKQSDVVMAFMTDKAKAALTKGTFTFGGELTATLGSKDVEVNVDTKGADVVAFASDTGIFAGASLNGTRVSPDESVMKKYYKEDMALSRTLETYTVAPTPLEEQFIGSINSGKPPGSS